MPKCDHCAASCVFTAPLGVSMLGVRGSVTVLRSIWRLRCRHFPVLMRAVREARWKQFPPVPWWRHDWCNCIDRRVPYSSAFGRRQRLGELVMMRLNTSAAESEPERRYRGPASATRLQEVVGAVSYHYCMSICLTVALFVGSWRQSMGTA